MLYRKVLATGLVLCAPALLAAENDREPPAVLDAVEVRGSIFLDPLLPDTLPSVEDGERQKVEQC